MRDGRARQAAARRRGLRPRHATRSCSTSATISARTGAALPDPPFLDLVPSASASPSRRALSRAAAGLALRLFDLPGQLMRGDDPISPARPDGEARRRVADADAARLSAPDRSARPAPRKAAPKAIAAPAPWCCGALRGEQARLRAGQCLHPVRRPGRRLRSHHRRGPRATTARCIRCSRRWSTITARNAASARRAS